MGRYKLLTGESRFRIHLIVQGLAIGAAAGFAGVCYRLLLGRAEAFSLSVLTGETTIPFPAVVLLWCGAAAAVGRLMEWEPLAQGSGIPQVEGELLGLVSMSWWKVIAAKFLGGGLAIALGLSLGREGPSVQIGAAAGKGIAVMQKRGKVEERLFLSSGASAGLSAAFNAPLAGVIFALEEVHKSFSPLVLLSAMMASLAADFVSKNFFGLGPVFSFGIPSVLPLGHYGHLLLLGLLCGGGGALFCRVLLDVQSLYGRLPVPSRYRVVIPALAALCIGPLLPGILGGGHALVERLAHGVLPLSMIFLLFGGKLLFTALSFGSGAAGGIFLPMLAVGASLGSLYGTAAVQWTGIDQAFILNFLIVGMAGFFAAVVRAPITAIILITEMTGSFTHLLSVSAVVIIAHVTADLLRARPVYDSLLLRMLRKSDGAVSAGKVLLEGTVCPGAPLDGRTVRDACLPEGCLLVSILRAEEEILPNGDTMLSAGDRITALADGARARRIREKMLDLTGVCTPEKYLWE